MLGFGLELQAKGRSRGDRVGCPGVALLWVGTSRRQRSDSQGGHVLFLLLIKTLFSHLGAFYRSSNDCRPLFIFKSEGHTHTQTLCTSVGLVD